MAEILFPALFVLLALGLPVAFAMAISVFVALSPKLMFWATDRCGNSAKS